ncbi:hypothetical protein RhiirA5_502756 [Rhizophagus irregularis]|uniref:Uncharacterized protein n=2 Tax=Rhizophagus irregularis TaxID=588596 RepID=A0A2N0PC87_9GLOM|nr:hypothetical protein GLOIN_2v1667542 [Rhizophagus irregularis DAOM 181602=DAOM 197198]PKC04442.1 hypothetical protein RhiirA5_502756 [Rhizophagus irregularis]PKC70067.1 hypothetical protein RhiirA1_112603 [Rhizophagus irregularis]POG65302.1 hypothetical protein GLOIN_2v1667542 [Rhizophagus irregularis DAOM 181602=DAOM 197198]UZO25609.1 hypothetical protein OCT59_017874 [Rhizophagus irregularis]CAB4484341.1 unnamed protein product [Rhizophagus irregularis]|eukprot:XP_025172168.1 hypothetical protein GLOIN_2v1667542 [Rhizophagus irregularis DAOM 181602=DAOM 197198]
MSGRNRIPQSTSQRLNKNRFSKNRNASKNRFKKNRFEELKQDVSDLINLARENNYILLQSKVDKLERENKRLRYDNDELSKFLQDDDESTDDDSNSEDEDDDSDSEDENESDDDSDSEDEDESDVSFRPAKRQMRNKLSDEERAKDLMKTLLKTFPELELNADETFRSEVNVVICQKLIPKLQKEMKAYNLSYEQVETWLQSIHRSKRNAYLRSNQSNQSNHYGFERDFIGSYSESDRSNQSTIIRKKKPKGSKANNIFEDEIENKAKSIMKALLNTYPYELTLRIEDTFRSQINKDICERLIPKLQEDVRPAYNLSYDQVETWLQTFHRYKRNTYLRSHFMMIDDD